MKRIKNTSWLLELDTAIKLCDKTVFKESSTVTPKESIRNFFYKEELNSGESVYIYILFNNKIERLELSRELESNCRKSSRTKLTWKNTSIETYLKNIELSKYKLVKRYEKTLDISEYVLMIFEKSNFIIKLSIRKNSDILLEKE